MALGNRSFRLPERRSQFGHGDADHWDADRLRRGYTGLVHERLGRSPRLPRWYVRRLGPADPSHGALREAAVALRHAQHAAAEPAAAAGGDLNDLAAREPQGALAEVLAAHAAASSAEVLDHLG